MTRILSFFLVVFLSCSACAPLSSDVSNESEIKGGETQNGGYGLLLPDGRTVSLDLYLRGSHNDTYLTSTEATLITTSERAILSRNLSKLTSPAVVEQVARKLSELRRRVTEMNMLFAVDYAISNINQYTWLRLDSSPCLDVHDERSPIPNKIQLAYREARWVRLCRDFGKLDEANQAALLVHEILYASLKQKSWVVELTGFLFSQDYAIFDDHSQQEFIELLNSVSPAINDEGKRVLVVKVGDASRASNPFPNLRLCFGQLRSKQFGVAESWLGFWLIPVSENCHVGLFNPEIFFKAETEKEWIYPSGNDDFVFRKGTVLGRFHPQTLTIDYLCNGNATEVCELRKTASSYEFAPLIYGNTMRDAVISESLARLDYLLKSVPESARTIEFRDEMNEALAEAFRLKRFPCVELLLQHKADEFGAIRQKALSDAITEKNSEVVTWLLDRNVKPSLDGETEITYFLKQQMLDIVERYIKLGFDVLKPNLGGATPLGIAVSQSTPFLDLIKQFVDSGADVNSKHEDGECLISKAQSNFSVLNTVLKSRRIDTKSTCFLQSLSSAMSVSSNDWNEKQSHPLARVFMQTPYDVNVLALCSLLNNLKGCGLRTPYIDDLVTSKTIQLEAVYETDFSNFPGTVQNSNTDLVQLIHAAAFSRNRLAIQTFVKAGASINALTQLKHLTPLQIYLGVYDEYGSEPSHIYELLQLGADVNLSESMDKLPLLMALKPTREFEEVAKILVEGGTSLEGIRYAYDKAIGKTGFSKSFLEFLKSAAQLP